MKIKLLFIVMIVAILPLGLTAKTKAKSKKRARTIVQVTPPKFKLKITNSAEIFWMEKIKLVNESEIKEIKMTELHIVEEPLSEEYDEDNYDEAVADVQTIYDDENEIIPEDCLWPAKNAITLLLDTELDANGNAVRRHVYIYEGKEDALADNGSHTQGPNKIKRVSFPANETGLEQWRFELLKCFASRNKNFIDAVNELKKVWKKGEITDSIFSVRVLENRKKHAQDSEAYRPYVLIKPMGNAESGDVIDALSVMCNDQISSFTIQDVNHNDSVMVFNSLYPGKDMPSGVNFYTYGIIEDYPQSLGIDIPDDNLGFGTNELRFDPAVTIEVKANQQHKEGALAYIMLDEIRLKKDIEELEDIANKFYGKKKKRKVNKSFSSPAFKQLVKNYGNSVTKPKWIEVEPVTPNKRTDKKNDFQQPLYEIANISEEINHLLVSNKHYDLFNDNILWIHTDRHTPYSTLKCVIDNLRKINLNRMILAY